MELAYEKPYARYDKQPLDFSVNIQQKFPLDTAGFSWQAWCDNYHSVTRSTCPFCPAIVISVQIYHLFLNKIFLNYI